MNPARFSRVLPVAEIFSFHRAEQIGPEVLVTVVVGDAEHTPHSHGLRAPLSRWAEMFAAVAADPA
ncbi:MAG: hypothetical protein NTV51_12350, partial [Verrucomicrobia bacterium]|nr:hypothetical protein [Verrucomicrobiota bacterium]